MSIPRSLDDIQEANSQGYGEVLSVFVDSYIDDESRGDALKRICREADIPHRKIQVTTVGEIFDTGLRMQVYYDDMPESHCHIYFSKPLEESIQAFVRCFGDPEMNPTGGKRRV